MIVITPGEIRAIVSTNLPDAILTIYMNTVINKIGECLESNYDEDTAKLIAMYMVAYLISVATGNDGVKTSKTSPNGASYSVQMSVAKGGINSNPYGQTVFMLDTSGCYKAFIPDTAFVKSFSRCTTGKCRR